MKKLLLFFVIGLSTSCRDLMNPLKQHKHHISQSPKHLLFQIGDKTGMLLIRGGPFTGSVVTFRKIWGVPCTLYCNSKDTLFVEDMRGPSPKKVEYGNALFIQKQNFWYLKEFTPIKD
jgi:hypothetical protein